MHLSSRTAKLCVEGTKEEFARHIDEARRLFAEAWDSAVDDYDAAMAAHYIAHLEPDPDEALHWNLIALERARLDDGAGKFMGSLLVSLGGAYENLGNTIEAQRYFALAAEHGVEHVRRPAGWDTSA